MHLLGNGIGEQMEMEKNAVHPSVTSNSSLTFEVKRAEILHCETLHINAKEATKGIFEIWSGGLDMEVYLGEANKRFLGLTLASPAALVQSLS